MKVVEERDGSKLTHEFKEMTPEKRPQDPDGDGTGVVFETLEHGGEYPDTMPQAIRVTDAEGRSCISMCRSPWKGRWSTAKASR